MKKTIQIIVREEMGFQDHLNINFDDETFLIGRVLFKMGVATQPSLSGEYPDYLFYEGWQTSLGRKLIKGVVSYDYETPIHEREPAFPAGKGEEVTMWGDAHIEWVGVAPVKPVAPTRLIVEWHKEVCELVPQLLKKEVARRVILRKNWGAAKNAELVAAGCSIIEVSAWWSLQWKREISAKEWYNLCNSYTRKQITFGLMAESSKYIKVAGLDMGKSFPRTMDVIIGLAKAYKIEKGKKMVIRKEVDIPPAYEAPDGSAIWSF